MIYNVTESEKKSVTESLCSIPEINIINQLHLTEKIRRVYKNRYEESLINILQFPKAMTNVGKINVTRKQLSDLTAMRRKYLFYRFSCNATEPRNCIL